MSTPCLICYFPCLTIAVVRQGDTSTEFYVILSGSFIVLKASDAHDRADTVPTGFVDNNKLGGLGTNVRS